MEGFVTIYVQLSEDGKHIRKWSREPFTDAQRFISQPEPPERPEPTEWR